MFLMTVYSAMGFGSDGWNQLHNSVFHDGYQSENYTGNWTNTTSFVTTINTGIQTDGSWPLTYNTGTEKRMVFRDASGLKVAKQDSLALTLSIADSQGSQAQYDVLDLFENGNYVLVSAVNSSGAPQLWDVLLDEGQKNVTTLPYEPEGFPHNLSVDLKGASVVCDSHPLTPTCYFRTAEDIYFKVFMNNGTKQIYNASMAAYNASKSAKSPTKYGVVPTPPLIYDIDRDGLLEGLWIRNYTYSPNSVIELIMLNLDNMSLETGFSDDGLLNITLSGSDSHRVESVQDFFLYQSDDAYNGTSQFEIFIGLKLYNASTANYYHREIGLTAAGITNFDNTEHLTTLDTYASSTVISYDVSGLSPNIGMCQLRQSTTGQNFVYVACWDGDGSSETESPMSIGSDIDYYNRIYSADVDGDGKHELVTSLGIINMTTWDISINFTDRFGISIGSNVSPIPVTNDNNIISFLWIDNNQSKFFDALGADINGIPEVTDTYGRSYANPVCNNTLDFRFSAKEYFTTPQPAGTNYRNDIGTDRERVVTDCGNSTATSYTYGGWHLSEPYVTCSFTKVGTYHVRIWLQDDHNTDILGAYLEEVVQVISGIPGQTCNLATVAIGANANPALDTSPNPITPTAVSGGMSRSIDLITGGDADSKLLVGFIILIIVVGGLGSVTGNPIVVAFSFLAAFIVLTAVGLFPAWILVTFLLVIIMLGIIVMKGQGGG